MNKIEVHCIDDLENIEARFESDRYIFRGESKKYDVPCLPKISRKGHEKCLKKEKKIYEDIKSELVELGYWKRLRNKNESEQAAGQWLSLFQHYGNPTRFLDWSSSFYVSLYYASEKDPKEQDKNGYIYVLDKNELINEYKAHYEGIPQAKIKDGFFTFSKKHYETFLVTKELVIYPVKPFVPNDRELTHKGCFTVSTVVDKGMLELCAQLDKDWITEIVVGRNFKKEARQYLYDSKGIDSKYLGDPIHTIIKRYIER